MGKAAPTALPCDAGCDADRDGQIWQTSSPPASPAAVGSPSVTQAPAWRAMAATSPNWNKMHALAEEGAPRTKMQSRPWATCRVYEPLSRPCPGRLQPPVHPLRDAVDILDDFDFVDIPAASIRSVHTLAWVRLVADLQRRGGHPPRSSPRLKMGSGTAVRPGRPCPAGQLRDGGGDRGLEACRQPPA